MLVLAAVGHLMPNPLQAAAVRILPLGDSITHGYWSGISTDYNSYRKMLKILLENNAHDIDFTGSLSDGDFADNQHEGHDGWYADHGTKTNTILSHVAGWMAATQADVVLLHIGTNDIIDNNASANEVSLVLDEILAANPRTTVVLASIINMQLGYEGREDITAYNSNLFAMAQGRMAAGEDILFVDMENGAGIDYGSSDMADRLHPSQLGYDKMATNWYPAVVIALERQTQKNRPRIEGISVAEGALALELVNLCSGAWVSVEQSRSLTPAVWTSMGGFVTSTSATNWTYTNHVPEDASFFRVILP
jgi:lysophospholipase L1-like esterase